jgi:hypothetical protein
VDVCFLAQFKQPGCFLLDVLKGSLSMFDFQKLGGILAVVTILLN